MKNTHTKELLFFETTKCFRRIFTFFISKKVKQEGAFILI